MDNLIAKHEASVITAAALVEARAADKKAEEELEQARTNLEQLHHPHFKPGQREVHVVGKYAVTIEQEERGHMFITIDKIQEGGTSVNRISDSENLSGEQEAEPQEAKA